MVVLIPTGEDITPTGSCEGREDERVGMVMLISADCCIRRLEAGKRRGGDSLVPVVVSGGSNVPVVPSPITTSPSAEPSIVVDKGDIGPSTPSAEAEPSIMVDKGNVGSLSLVGLPLSLLVVLSSGVTTAKLAVQS